MNLMSGTCLFIMMALGACNENLMKPIGPKMCVQLCARTVGCRSAIYTTSDLLCEVEQETINLTGIRTTRQFQLLKAKDISYQEMDNCSRGSKLFHSRTGQMLCKHVESYEDLTPGVAKSINALHWACKEGNLNMVKYIITHRLADINCVETWGKTPVMTAARSGRLSVFDFLVRQGALLNATNIGGNNVLDIACKGGDIEIVRRLIEQHHFDRESRNSHGYTPLMHAVYYCHKNMYNFLVKKGCDFAAVTGKKESILMLSCLCCNVEVVIDMLNLNASSVNATDQKGETAVMKAARRGHLKIVQLLVKKGCNLTVVDKKGASVLHKACEKGRVEIVKYLISQSVISGLIKLKDKSGKTPVDMANENQHEDVVNVLRAKV